MSATGQEPFVVFGFQSTHDALSAEAALDAAGLPLTVMPTPKALGALCGIALRIAEPDRADAETVLHDAGIEWSGSISILDR